MSHIFYWHKDVVNQDFIRSNKIMVIKNSVTINENVFNTFNSLCLYKNAKAIFNELNITEAWALDNSEFNGNLILKNDFKCKNNIKYQGNLNAKNIYADNNFSLTGNLCASCDITLGNNAQITGDIHCKILRIGENASINGSIYAEEVYTKNNFKCSMDLLCDKLVTLNNSSLLGKNIIGYLSSKKCTLISGCTFIELYSSDNFKSTGSLGGAKLILGNNSSIDGNITIDDNFVTGNDSYIKGDVICMGRFEHGLNTIIKGFKKVSLESELP